MKPHKASSLPPLPPRGRRGVSPRFTSAPAATEGRASRSERPAGRGEGKTLSRLLGFLGFLSIALFTLSATTPAKKDSADLLVLNARLVTMDDALSLFDPGGMAVKAGRIVAVGPSSEIATRFSSRSVYDASGKLVLPGLVNTHTHAAMTILRALAEDLPLDRWLTEHLFPAEAKNVSPDFVHDGTLLASLEMIRGGTTTFADMYYFESDAARAVETAGLRAVLGETFIDFPVPDHKDLAETLTFMEKFVAKWKGHPRITPAVAPHAPYTCSKETLLAARDFAQKHGIPILIHVAETKKELEDARQKWQKSPVLYLASIGFFEAKVPILAAHAIWMDGQDRGLIKQFGVGLAHNPESNMKLSSGIADVVLWEKEGLIWGIGTDGPAGSNNDLSMFEAMDFTGKLAKVSAGDPTALPAREIVAAATRGGAKALGLEAKIGSLEPGKQADFIAIETRRAHIQPFEDVYSALVYSVKASDVTDVWVDGKRLLAAGRLTTLEENKVLNEATRWREKVRRSLMP